MQLKQLDHANVLTANLAEMTTWYGDVLGMKSGPRPPFSVDGAWLYIGDQAAVHLVKVAEQPKTSEPRIEHFAFSATGLPEFLQTLENRGIAHSVDAVPTFPVVQVNLADPDGNHIHVDFHSSEHDESNAK